ncbi:MAG: TRAP transporter substrate-binding protein DctP [Deltaproteobacteria bacterium]|nr:TRAP transporter substrate-binding protein DctP [Deltaproteobacteria bacterium]
MKVADWMPLSHYTVSQGGLVFMKKATELSKGRIQFKHFPAGQLGKGKDMLQLAQRGVAEIVNIAPAYITDKFPLTGVIELPGIYEGSCNGARAFAQLVAPGGILYEQEYKPNGVRVLFVGPLGAYRVLTADREVKRAKDFKGLKLRTAGGPMDITAKTIGAVSVRMSGPEVLPSLTRGTLDGVFWPLQSVKPWGLQSGLKYMTPNLGVGSFVILYAISDKAWKKLSPEDQKILTEAGKYATKWHCEYVDTHEVKTIKWLEDYGIKPVPLPQKDVDMITDKYTKIYKDWATSLDKRGRPGTEALKAFQSALSK